jgi:AcrR family transcriptional regulator
VGARSRGGRPSRLRAEQIGDDILDVATRLFLTLGYGATSIEAVAQQARISKRTFYHRFRDKPALFGAVVHRLVERLRPAEDAALFAGPSVEETLLRLARIILRAALSPEALSLHRVIVAEATRFPELAAVANSDGLRHYAITRIAQLLAEEAAARQRTLADPDFAAEQFLQIVVSVPQRRALGLGRPMSGPALERWAELSVNLFLHGCWGASS